MLQRRKQGRGNPHGRPEVPGRAAAPSRGLESAVNPGLPRQRVQENRVGGTRGERWPAWQSGRGSGPRSDSPLPAGRGVRTGAAGPPPRERLLH